MFENKRRLLQTFGTIMLICIVGIAAYLSYLVSQTDISVVDPTSIFGGQEEYHYLSFNYLLSRHADSTMNYCGVVTLDDHTVVTAAHCITPSDTVYLGKGEFKLTLGSMPTANSLTTLQDRQGPAADLAVLDFAESNPILKTPAQIAKPIPGCAYQLVGYGKSSNSENITRRSIPVCIDAVMDDTFTLTTTIPQDCFGIQAGIIYFDNSEKVAGIVASAASDSEPSSLCSLNTTGVAVRLDSHQQLIQAAKLTQMGNEFAKVDISPSLNIMDKLTYSVLAAGPGIQSSFARVTVVLIGTLVGVFFLLVIKPKLWGNANEPRHRT